VLRLRQMETNVSAMLATECGEWSKFLALQNGEEWTD
jgi:hypothetical protein